MTYVDGFVVAVPTPNREAYRAFAERAAAVFREHGALRVVECWGDDVPEGKLTSFPINAKVMADPRLQPTTNPLPFDGKRLIYGGFEMIVDR